MLNQDALPIFSYFFFQFRNCEIKSIFLSNNLGFQLLFTSVTLFKHKYNLQSDRSDNIP